MRMGRTLILCAAFLLSDFSAQAAVQDDEPDDPRAYMHGIAAVADGKGGDWVFFSSSGLPPQGAGEDDDWTHDIYVGDWSPAMPHLKPRPFIARPEAQEPVSVAETTDGHIMVLVEDGWESENEVDERYALYDQNLKTILSYYETAADGGHSGHIAAVGNRFIAFYSDNWVQGGGVDNLGTGRGVNAKIYDSKGRELRFVPVAPHRREWWPLIAAAPRHALLVWQAYIPGQTYATLKYALLDPENGHLTPPQILHDHIKYYTYAVQYLALVNRFLVVGTTDDNHGFADLIDEKGDSIAQIDCMPPVVREAGIATLASDAFMPSADNRLLRFHATDSSLILAGILPSPLIWESVGSIGLPKSDTVLHWFSLTKTGLQESDFDVKTSQPPMSRDMCR